MLGAIIGDIAGSTRERHNVKTEDFELLPRGSRFTDDTVMTLAVAEWLMTDADHRPETLVACMQRLGRRYPGAGYGGRFRRWLHSDDPQPYGSYANGSAMRVSPVGLYAATLDEALELARITASVSHNHPEGIRGAQTIAGCVFLKRHTESGGAERIRQFVTEEMGYDLDFRLADLRPGYTFDVSCRGSVPIAVKAWLERSDRPAVDALRLAISMGGDSDTIGSMAAAIAATHRPYTIAADFARDTIAQCRALLPPDLLDINDRFEAFISRPADESYEVKPRLFAGEYPGAIKREDAEAKLKRMHRFGVRHFVDLTEEGELKPYSGLLPADTTYTRFPVRDLCAPNSIETVHGLIDRLEQMLHQDSAGIYLHCRGGVGRTATIAACIIARSSERPDADEALAALRSRFAEMPKSHGRMAPETPGQEDFVRRFAESCVRLKEQRRQRTLDRVRGSLMGGAAGDALGYPVEFMSRDSIVRRYGTRGITRFETDDRGKALVSDDTQMTLFTANGMLTGLTRGYMRGLGGSPEEYVDGAYIDWFYTQTGIKDEGQYNDFHYSWLRDLPALAHRRAPGNTCLTACESLLWRREVNNNSKGCGGIMRVAPMALFNAGFTVRYGRPFHSLKEMDEAGAHIAAVTHLHPLGFLPAAMLTHLLYRLIMLDTEEIKARIGALALETVDALEGVCEGKYDESKRYLAGLTRKAVELASGGGSDADNIRLLGEGWTGEETWAIALYCAVRHIDSMEQAIVAAVNHDGDSDSTGSVCGNIMGAVYGYEAICHERLFCPPGRGFADTIELADIILALADDLYTGCIISEYEPIDTPAGQQWYERYCLMKPSGISAAAASGKP